MVQPRLETQISPAELTAPYFDSRLGLSSWRSLSGYGSLLYAESPGYFVVAGEPRCHPDQLPHLVEEFEREGERRRKKVLYFGLPESMRHSLSGAQPRGAVHIGDVPIFALGRWQQREQFPRSILAQMRRAENHGIRIRHLPTPPTDTFKLRSCLKAWLLGKGLPPLQFLTCPFLLDPWPELGVWIAENEAGGIVGFTTLSDLLFRKILRVDIIARAPGAPNGCTELLIAMAFQAAALQGYPHITLGLAPLSQRSRQSVRNPVWFDALSHWGRRWGASWYSFQGLEAFKAKFHPDDWYPYYCVSRSKKFSATDLLAMLRAFTQGSLLQFGWQSLCWRLGWRSTRAWPI